MFDQEVQDVWVRPHATTDCYDTRKEYNAIDMFVWRRYRSKFLRHHEWVERNPEQADEQLKLMYKTYYNDTFKQITGRSWLDSDN